MTEKKVRRPRLYLRGRITHRLITKTAAELFLELGYFKTSLVLISKRAFVGYDTIYAHFKNKDHTLTTIADEIFVRFYETIEEPFEPEDKEQARNSFYNLALTLIKLTAASGCIKLCSSGLKYAATCALLVRLRTLPQKLTRCLKFKRYKGQAVKDLPPPGGQNTIAS